MFSEAGTIYCRVLQGSLLESLLVLLYINDIVPALSDSHAHIYADNTSIFYQDMEVTENGNVLNKEFENVCKWYVDNKLSFFSVKKNLPELDIIYSNNRIKRFHMV